MLLFGIFFCFFSQFSLEGRGIHCLHVLGFEWIVWFVVLVSRFCFSCFHFSPQKGIFFGCFFLEGLDVLLIFFFCCASSILLWFHFHKADSAKSFSVLSYWIENEWNPIQFLFFFFGKWERVAWVWTNLSKDEGIEDDLIELKKGMGKFEKKNFFAGFVINVWKGNSSFPKENSI